MVFRPLSDPYVEAAFWTGLAALVFTLLIGLQILRLRISLRRSQKLEARVIAKWRPVLNAAALGEETHALPPLSRTERIPLLRLWVHLQASMRGDAQAALNELARNIGLDRYARGLLDGRSRTRQMLASLALGYLRDGQAWSRLRHLAGQDSGPLAMHALWALVRIDPQAAAEVMMPYFIGQKNWEISQAAGILEEARSQIATVLERILPQSDAPSLERGLRLSEALCIRLPAAILADALRSPHATVAIAALRGVSTAENIDEVRRLMEHEDWQVRVQAAKAIGRVGDASDVGRLAHMLKDRQWWVRYRAAQALLELPSLSQEEMAAMRAALDDRYGSDMFAHALAEKGMA